MSRIAKGPRLYLRRGRQKANGITLPDRYFIRDRQTEIGTGCGPDRREGTGGAEEQLAEYILSKNAQPLAETEDDGRARRSDPAQVFVAEVLAEYAAGPALKLAHPGKEASFIEALLVWWDDKTLSDVRRSTCEAYVAKRITDPNRTYKDPETAPRVSDQTARRELECLQTAISKWHEEHHLKVVPQVVLPRKAETPRDALTRDMAARLLKAAMGYRFTEGHGPVLPGKLRPGTWSRLSASSRQNRRHLTRFILVSIYTGSRSSVTTAALWEESPHNPWADVISGVMYRRGREVRDHRNKRRPIVAFPDRLLTHMRRWRRMDQARGINAVIHFNGEPILRVKTSFQSCVIDAGLAREISPHWMRHTSATWLMEKKADLWAAAGFLGMSVTTLVKNYGHHRPDYQDDVRNKFG
jgi:integrase